MALNRYNSALQLFLHTLFHKIAKEGNNEFGGSAQLFGNLVRET